MSDMNLRPRSQRVSQRATRLAQVRTQQQRPPTEAYPGLNDITDAFEALPLDVARYFTLFKEVHSKYSMHVEPLHKSIAEFKALPRTEEFKKKRSALASHIISKLSSIIPCLDEKMHIAAFGADNTVKWIKRINDDFELIFKHEIPESVKFGQHNHPAIIHDAKIPDNKSAQSQRSESRREALAAKKAANENNNEEETTPAPATTTSGRGKGRPRAEKEATPSAPTTKKRKTNTAQTNSSGSANNGSAGNSAGNSTNTAQNFTSNVSNAPTAHSQLLQTVTVTHPQTNALKTEDDSRPGTPSGSKRSRTSTKKKQEHEQQMQQESEQQEAGIYRDGDGQMRNALGELVYCYCNQVSYGEMVGCDDNDCKREWFHLPCTGLTTLPRGKWYCDECKQKRGKK